MKKEREFYAFEIKNSAGNFVRVRKILNGKCIDEGEDRWLSEQEQEKLRTKLMYETFYKNCGKEGIPKVININGFEINKKNGKFIIKYFNSGIKSGESAYDLELINEEKENSIIEKLSDYCLNNMEAEITVISLIFIIHEVERVIYD